MDSTRLSDLPLGNGSSDGYDENITYSVQSRPVQMHPTVFPNPESTMRQHPDDLEHQPDLGKTNYVPLNIHPNPYSQTASTPQQEHPPRQERPRPPPKQLPSVVESSSRPIEEYVPKQHVRLPSHDMSIDPLDFTQDEEIQANYIPKPDLSKIKVRDYIKEYDETEGSRLYDHEVEKAQREWYDIIFHSAQNPLLVFFIFFIFQMQVIKRVLIIVFDRLGKFGKWFIDDTGNLTTSGMIFKSSIFTTIYMTIHWFLKVV